VFTARDDRGPVLGVLAEGERWVPASAEDALDARGRPAVEDRAVLNLGGQPGGAVEVVESRVGGAALDVLDL
jgi:hypothetical protein